MTSTLATALGLGLVAGISPGPLLVLVITASLRGGLRHGFATACAPLLSDLLPVAVTLIALGRMPLAWLDWLGVVGGLAVVWVGAQTARESRGATLDASADELPPLRRSLGRAVLVNLVSPHPWITWLTVLGPLTVRAEHAQRGATVVFLLGFYVGLVGAKALLAVLVARGRGILTTHRYRVVLMVSGIALAVFGVAMSVDFGRHLL